MECKTDPSQFILLFVLAVVGGGVLFLYQFGNACALYDICYHGYWQESETNDEEWKVANTHCKEGKNKEYSRKLLRKSKQHYLLEANIHLPSSHIESSQETYGFMYNFRSPAHSPTLCLCRFFLSMFFVLSLYFCSPTLFHISLSQFRSFHHVDWFLLSIFYFCIRFAPLQVSTYIHPSASSPSTYQPKPYSFSITPFSHVSSFRFLVLYFRFIISYAQYLLVHCTRVMQPKQNNFKFANLLSCVAMGYSKRKHTNHKEARKKLGLIDERKRDIDKTEETHAHTHGIGLCKKIESRNAIQ